MITMHHGDLVDWRFTVILQLRPTKLKARAPELVLVLLLLLLLLPWSLLSIHHHGLLLAPCYRRGPREVADSPLYTLACNSYDAAVASFAH
jgi:hypothetical protein